MGATLTTPHTHNDLTNSSVSLPPCFRCLTRRIQLRELQQIQKNYTKKKKNLDDLSTLGIGCCHLAGNYLPVRAVDRPPKKKRWQSKIRPCLRDGEERLRVRCEEKAETERLIMRPVKQTRLSEQQREAELVGLETHTLVPPSLDANLGAFI